MSETCAVEENGMMHPEANPWYAAKEHNVEKFGPVRSSLCGQVDPQKARGDHFCTNGADDPWRATKENPCRSTKDLPRDPIPTHILDEARKVVYGRGEKEYGHPRDDFSRTAGMLTALFADKLRPGAKFEPEDVAKAMICVKLSRSRTDEKADNYVDIAGYAETAARVLWDAKPDG